MTSLIDPELTMRLGALDPSWTGRIQDYASAAFMWRGYSQADALDIARALHWQAVGLDLGATAWDVVDALSVRPLPPEEHRRASDLLDLRSQANHGSTNPVAADHARLRSDDYLRAGRRLSHGLAMLLALEGAAA